MANKFISIGARYGVVDSSDVLPSRTTVSRHLSDVVDREKSLLIAVIEKLEWLGITTDMWTSSKTNVSYITVTAQFVDSNWCVRSVILATRSVDDKHTGECIRKNVRSVLDEYHAAKSGNVYVTDDAANMKAAFRDNIWIGCSCHNLNLVLSHGMEANPNQADADINGLPSEVIQLVQTCKELVTLAKRTKINSKLKTTVKRCIVTRWNSTLTTLKSISANLDDLRALTSDPTSNKNLLRLLADINESELGDLIKVLEPFDLATKCLSTDSKPSIHLVLPTKIKLLKQMTPLATDSEVIAQLKSHLNCQLMQYFSVTNVHLVAALLDPRARNNTNILSTDDQNTAVTSLRQMVADMVLRPDSESEEELREPRCKKSKLESTTASATSTSEEDLYGGPTGLRSLLYMR